MTNRYRTVLRVRPIPVIRYRKNPAQAAPPAAAPPKKSSLLLPLVIGGAVAAAAGVGIYYVVKTYGGGGGGGGCTSSSPCSSACPNGLCSGTDVCSRGVCVAGVTGCTTDAQCPGGEVCQNGYCTSNPCSGTCTCANGEACQSQCSCGGSGNWSCNEGACYNPYAYSATQDTVSLQIATLGYRSDYCCEYLVTAYTHMCGFCAIGCGPSLPTGGSGTFTVTVTDQFQHPMPNATVKASASPNSVGNGFLSVSPSSVVTDSNGEATFTITVAGPPPPYNDSSQYPGCAGTDTVPLAGIQYCSGGTGYTDNLLNGSGTSVGQVNWSVGGSSINGLVLVTALVYGSCTYIGMNPLPPAPCGGNCR